MSKIQGLGISKCGFIWKMSLKLIWKYPKITLPLAIFILLEAAVLSFISLAPSPLLLPLLGPPIRVFFGEMYLHYPYNLLLLPTLFEYGETVLTIFFLPLIIATTVLMVYGAVTQQKKAEFVQSLFLSVKRYLILLGIWLIGAVLVWGIFQGAKLLLFRFYTQEAAAFLDLPAWRMPRLTQAGSLLLSLLLEPFLCFCIPVIMIEGKKVFASIKSGLSLGFSLYLLSFVLILVPTILDLFIVIIKQKLLTQLMDRFIPEVVFVIMGIGFITYLCSQLLRTLSITLVFLWVKEKEAEKQ